MDTYQELQARVAASPHGIYSLVPELVYDNQGNCGDIADAVLAQVVGPLVAEVERSQMFNIERLIGQVTKDLQMLKDTSSSDAHINDCGATLAMLHHLRQRFDYLTRRTPPAQPAHSGPTLGAAGGAVDA